MTTLRTVIGLLLFALLAVGCDAASSADAGVEDSGPSTPDAGSDAAVPDAAVPDAAVSDASVRDATVPDSGTDASFDLAPPAGVAFVDGDLRPAFASGTVAIQRAADERGVASYGLVWLDGAGAASELFAIVTAAADPLAIAVPAETAVPAGAIELAAVTVDAGGRTSAPSAGVPADNFVRHEDIGADLGGDPLKTPTVLRHDPSGVLFVVGVAPDHSGSIRACGAAGCTEVLSEPFGATHASAAITDDRLYAVFGAFRTQLVVCSLAPDATLGACTTTALGPGAHSVAQPSLALGDGALYLAYNDTGNDWKPAVFVCPHEGPSTVSPCTSHDISAGVPYFGGWYPSVDATSSSLYVASGTGGSAPSHLTHCPLDAAGAPSGCTSRSVAGSYPRVAVRGARAYVVASGPAVTTCVLGAGGVPTACTSRVGGPPDENAKVALALDADELFLVHADPTDRRPRAERCPIDASGDLGACTAMDTSAGSGFALQWLSMIATDTERWIAGSNEAGTPATMLMRCTDAAPCSAELATIGLGGTSFDPQVFASSTHLYALTVERALLRNLLFACAMGTDGALSACDGQVLPLSYAGLFNGYGPAVAGGRLYFFGLAVSVCETGSDGLVTSCTEHPLPEGFYAGQYSVIGAAAGDRLIAAGLRAVVPRELAITSCALDASGAPAGCTSEVHAVRDATHTPEAILLGAHQVYVLMRDDLERFVYGCPLGAAGELEACSRYSIGSHGNEGSGIRPSLAAARDALYVGSGSNAGPVVNRCPMDPTGALGTCVRTELDAALRIGPHSRLVHTGAHLLFAGNASRGIAEVIACGVDAAGGPAGCAAIDASGGQPAGSAVWTGAVHDPMRGTIHIVADDASRRHRPSAYWFRAW